jgi:hypothetical protein
MTLVLMLYFVPSRAKVRVKPINPTASQPRSFSRLTLGSRVVGLPNVPVYTGSGSGVDDTSELIISACTIIRTHLLLPEQRPTSFRACEGSLEVYECD